VESFQTDPVEAFYLRAVVRIRSRGETPPLNLAEFRAELHRLGFVIGEGGSEQDPRHDPVAALEAIKTIHATDRREMSETEAREFVSYPIYILPSSRFPLSFGKHRSNRGRKSKLSAHQRQLAFAYNARKGLYHLLVRLPEIRKAAAITRGRSGDRLRNIVKQFIARVGNRGLHRRSLVRELELEFARQGEQSPTTRHLRRLILAENRRRLNYGK
jgi:hypothetical protein